MNKKIYDEIYKVSKSRRTAKKFNSNLNVSDEDLNKIFEFVNTAPHSIGGEFWRVINFRRNNEMKEEILNFMQFNKDKSKEASELLFFVTKTNEFFSEDNKQLKDTARRNAKASAENYGWELDEKLLEQSIKNWSYHNFGHNDFNMGDWSARQAYIAVGFLVLGAKSLNIDSAIMEGFELALTYFLREKEIIDFDEQITLAVALGYTEGIDPKPFIGKEQLRYPIDINFKNYK